MNILLAVDGSACSLKAVRYLLHHWSTCGDDARLTVLHVDQPFVERTLTVLGRQGVSAAHERNAKLALSRAITLLKRARLAHACAVLVGEPGPEIARFAAKGRFDLVMMGSHGHGAISGLVLGSVVTKVLALCAVPVLVVR